jgi:hypothetical protein
MTIPDISRVDTTFKVVVGFVLGVVVFVASIGIYRWASDVHSNSARTAYWNQFDYEAKHNLETIKQGVDRLTAEMDKAKYAKEADEEYQRIGKAVAKELVKAISER